jgi:hypothetical protein
MNNWTFYATVVLISAAILIGQGYVIWLITGSKQTGTIVMVAVGASIVCVIAFFDDRFPKIEQISKRHSRELDRHHRFEGALRSPERVQKPHPPIMIGGSGQG